MSKVIFWFLIVCLLVAITGVLIGNERSAPLPRSDEDIVSSRSVIKYSGKHGVIIMEFTTPLGVTVCQHQVEV